MAESLFTVYDSSWSIRRQDTIAQGALTNSKRPECFVKGVYPTELQHAKGCHVIDTTGKKYIDFTCGLGSNLLGYGNQPIAQAAYMAALQGCNLPLTSISEIILAEKIKEIVPFIHKMKFLKTGSEACSAAIKIARAKTNRLIVLSEGYHGHHDPFVSLTSPAIGVPPDMFISRFQDRDLTESVAAVIVEPIMTDLTEFRIEWLRNLREECTRVGALLIFDEIITGMRFPKYTFSNQYNIIPDIICMGKALGNGFPIALVGGSDSVMNCGEYFVSSTFAGDMVSIAAAQKVIEQIQIGKFKLQDLWDKGTEFISKFNSLSPSSLQIQGYATRGVFVGDILTKTLFWQECVEAGIFFGSSWFINFAHFEHLDDVINSCQDILMRIRTGSVKLKGQLPQSPFSQLVREK